MATDLRELRPRLMIDTGGKLTEEKLDELLLHGVELFNAEASQVFTPTGMVLDRDANAIEKRALTLFALLGYQDELIIEASKNAIVHSNVAGRTDLGNIEWALGKRRAETRERLNRTLNRLTNIAVAGEVHAEELGHSLDVAWWDC